MTTQTKLAVRADGSIIDDALPAFDVVITESLVVDADVPTTYRAARTLDFLKVRTPLLDAAFWVRGLPERFGHERTGAPTRLILGAGDPLPGWLVLGEVPDTELAFGAVGKFWQGRIEWRSVERSAYTDFSEPGFGKIACAFRVKPCADGRSLLSYECRTATTSPVARAKFARYWRVIRPFVAYIMRATIATIRADAEASTMEEQ